MELCSLMIYVFQCAICTYYFIIIQVCIQEEIVSAGRLIYNLGCQRKEVCNCKLYLIFNVVRKWKCNVICVCLRIVVSNTCVMFLFVSFYFVLPYIFYSFSGLFVFIAPSVFSNVYLEDKSKHQRDNWSRKYWVS